MRKPYYCTDCKKCFKNPQPHMCNGAMRYKVRFLDLNTAPKEFVRKVKDWRSREKKEEPHTKTKEIVRDWSDKV